MCKKNENIKKYLQIKNIFDKKLSINKILELIADTKILKKILIDSQELKLIKTFRYPSLIEKNFNWRVLSPIFNRKIFF